MNYLTSCPGCGRELSAHVGLPQDAPWQCLNCRRGWWIAELSTDARKVFRPRVMDFGHGGAVRKAVASEYEEAVKRGHSVHPSMSKLPGVAGRLAKLRKG